MSSQMTLRWGIVTAGKISHDFVNAFNTCTNRGDQVIVGVAARNKDKAAELAKLYGIEKVFDSYQALAESKDIDVAYIGSLNPDHYPLTKLFLENGKHVLCEKPLCLNYKQAESLIKLAESKKLFLMEAVWSRFFPAYIALEEQIKSGKLGDLKYVEVNFGVPIAGVERVWKKEFGGGVILDLGVYVLQLAQYVFKDEPRKVIANGEVNEEGVDMVNTIVMEYNNDRRAVLNVSGKFRLWNKATVYGTKGRITLEDPFHCPTTLVHVNGDVEKFPLHKSPIDYNFENSAGLVYQAIETARCIKEGLLESPRMPHKESLLLAKLEETVRKQLGVHFEVDEMEFP
ncbi:hypothetical protein K1T71_001773 [Dendrolimus kikuchii]|uniref:Uncharacterized protein n=1 Tax=Dendrolimus kikuchii TaxID=765133 RepID=A0ACC1DEL7_9NEOP|nr:hypothetical protein K1T71_001773 [Dendrolimus kikuchii]